MLISSFHKLIVLENHTSLLAVLEKLLKFTKSCSISGESSEREETKYRQGQKTRKEKEETDMIFLKGEGG